MTQEQNRNDGGSDVRGLVEKLGSEAAKCHHASKTDEFSKAIADGYAEYAALFGGAADALSSLLERVEAAEEREKEVTGFARDLLARSRAVGVLGATEVGEAEELLDAILNPPEAQQ